MPDYRLYFHNAAGHFMRAEIVDVADDASALAKACELDHAHCIEVWQGKRMVGNVKPAEKPD
jgi:Leu/Phe-tRNA-protein transferase